MSYLTCVGFVPDIVIHVSICVGVSRLMDLLADSREVIRNDVSLHANTFGWGTH